MKEYAKMFTEKVAVIHSAFDEKPTTVAFVEVAKELSDEEKCEVAFKKTNTIEKHGGRTKVLPKCLVVMLVDKPHW